MLLRAIAFADRAEWHIAEPMPVAAARWKPLHHVEKGLTRMGAAFQLVTEGPPAGPAGNQGTPQAILLITDGRPTDPAEFEAGLRF